MKRPSVSLQHSRTRSTLCGLLAFLCGCALSRSQDHAALSKPIVAHLHGWGRACTGELILTPRTISWSTPFNTCKASPFRQIDSHDDHGGNLDRIYHLTHPSRGCDLPYIEVMHSIGGPGLSWSAQASISLDAARHRVMVNTVGCQLEQVSFEAPR